MSESREIQQEIRKEVHHYHGSWCCLAPWSRRGAIICGAALIIFGGVWLLSSLGLITEEWWEMAVPLLLVVWGLAVVAGSSALPGRSSSEPG